MSFSIIQAINPTMNWENFSIKNSSEDNEANKSTMNIAIKTINSHFQGKIKDLTPVCPMAVRNLIIAQLNARAAANNCPNEQNIRIKTLFHSSIIGIGWVLTLAARIIRVVFRIVFAPISLLVAAYQQIRYGSYMEKIEGKHNIIKEDLIRIGREVVDLGVTIYAGLIGTINTLAPLAIPTDHLRKMYAERIDEERLRNQAFTEAKKDYNSEKERNYKQWNDAKSL